MRGALGGAALVLGGQARTSSTALASVPTGRVASAKPVPLPTPAQVRADFTKMVEFGPRLTGSDAHNNYIQWLGDEFVKAGLELTPCDVYQTDRWLADGFGLTILEGSGAGEVKVASYMPRSQQTPAAGVTGPLVYGGTVPALSASALDIVALEDAIKAYPAALQAWAAALTGTLAGAAAGSVLLVDVPMPVPLTAAAFLPLSTYTNWPGHTDADWATSDYKRLWIEPGVEMPLAPYQSTGASAVVFIIDASFEALAGGYLPFLQGYQPIPALYVDRDTGASLRRLAATRPNTRLTLTATRAKVPTPSITAILPGTSDETIIFNSHTDGQGFAEENGGVAFVHLARYFATLPPQQRLRRTLVFALWPGHMTFDLPETQGWIDEHPDLVSRAAAALTVEHLGCTEWNDTLDGGYHATGQPELFGIWTTQGRMFEIVKASVIKHDIPRAFMMRPPVQFGVGGAFQGAGVPQIGAIAGPEYLVTVSPDGDLDKLDEALAARQIAWLADLAVQLDSVPAAELRAGDPTLGTPSIPPSGVAAPSVHQECVGLAPLTTTTKAPPGCPKATGRLEGSVLGLVKLGMTRAQARHAYAESSNRGRGYEDFFCLSPNGVRVGYASMVLLESLRPRRRPHYADRVVWASTSNTHYSLRGIRAGDSLHSAVRLLKLSRPYHVGLNIWYFAENGPADAILKVRDGIVEEIGIADKSLCRTDRARRTFVRSFS